MNLSYGKNIISMSYANMSFNTVMDETSRFKQALFKAYMHGTKVSSSIYKGYIDVLKDFVDSWSKAANDIENGIKSSDTEASSSIPYSYIKDYIYGNYDYAAVLPYVDGLLAGFTDGNFKDEKDSANFENHVKDRAFINRLNSAGGLVEDVVMISRAVKPVDKTDSAMFNAIKSQRIFNYRDADVINNAVKKTVEYLCTSPEATSKIDTMFQTTPKNAIVIINSSADFIAYTVLAYATRVLAIYAYAKPWIETAITEAVATVDEKDENKDDLKVVIVDELLCRDHTKYKELIDKFRIICKDIKIDEKELFDWPNRSNSDNAPLVEPDSAVKGIVVASKYHDALIKNGLYQFIMEDPVFDASFFSRNGRHDSILWFHDKLDAAVINGQQANGDIISPKQDLVNIIRIIGNEIKTEAEYKKLAADCFNIFTYMMYRIRAVQYTSEVHTFNPDFCDHDLKENLAAAENAKILRELYCEIATAVFHRLMDIKLHIDQAKEDEFKDIMTKITIKVPGGEKDDVTHKDDMMVGVPDTTRGNIIHAFDESLDAFYMMHDYEFLSMYDEYAREILGGDYYLEAGEDNFFNKIIAAIKKAIERLRTWIHDTNRQRVVKWCQDHKSELESMTYNGTMEGLVDYNRDINVEWLAKITTTLQNFNTNVKKYQADINEFRKAIYGNDQIYNLFFENGQKTDAKTSREKLEKLIFAGNPDLDKPMTLVNDQIKKTMTEVWLPIMESSTESVDLYTKKTNELAEAIKKVKDSLASNEYKTESDNGKPEDATSTETVAAEADKQEQQKAADNKGDAVTVSGGENKNDAFKTQVMQELDLMAANVLIPMSTFIKDYYLKVYSYIQKAYTLGRK